MTLEQVNELLKPLKGMKLQWHVFSNQLKNDFEAEIKEIKYVDDISENLVVKFKGKKNHLIVSSPMTIKVTDNEKVLKYEVFSKDKERILLFGYVKEGSPTLG